jgi:diguanylate cyclase (GGDEF)-like protein
MLERPIQRTRLAYLVAVAASGALAVAAMVVARLDASACLLWWDVSWTAAAVGALVGTLAARSRALPRQRERWTLWTLATLSWLAGQLAWDAYSIMGSPQSPNATDFGWWGFAILVVVGLTRARTSSGLVRLVALVEALPLMTAVMALTFAELWDEAVSSPLPVLARISALIYPAVYVTAAVLTLQAMIGGALRRARTPGLGVVLAGIVAQAVAFIAWSEMLLEDRYVVGATLVDPLFTLGLLAIGLGAGLAARTPERPALGVEPSRWGGALPSVTFLIILVALVAAPFGESAAPQRAVLAIGALACAVTLIVRGALLERRQRTVLAGERAARLALAERESDLARLNARLAQDSRHDPLTGLRNRRALDDDLPGIEARARRHEQPYAVALCDVDRFKAYNDQMGHLAGDTALRLVTDIVARELRGEDVAYRFGGEELLLVLAMAETDAATAAAERVRNAVETAAIPHPGGIGGRLTVSVGVASGTDDSSTLLARADAALYAAKAGGRNRVVCSSSDDAPRPAGMLNAAGAQEPVMRQLRNVQAVARAASSGEGSLGVLRATADIIRSELRFETVIANLLDPSTDELEVVHVVGDDETRAALLGTRSGWSHWQSMLDPRFDRGGAIWLPAGTHDWSAGPPAWIPDADAARTNDEWDPEDALLLPLRGDGGEILAILSLDQPLSGRRPDDDELAVLVAVADHAAVSLLHAQHASAARDAASQDRLEAVMLLAETLDLRDAGTARHSQTVGEYARLTAEQLGLPAARVGRIHAAGVLHDLGKLAIADAILHKPGQLDDFEWREIQRHPDIGARILEHAGLADLADWVRAHHERIDGRGYPLGLRDTDIPLEARILAVADAYEAMCADRPYRTGMHEHDARAELLRHSGTQFDPEVIDAFLSAIDTADVPPSPPPGDGEPQPNVRGTAPSPARR